MKPLELDQLEQMDAYLTHSMDEVERTRFEQLLSDSVELREELLLMQDLRMAFNTLPEVKCPTHVTENVMKVVDQELHAYYGSRLKVFWQQLFTPAWRPAVAFAAIAVLVMGIILVKNNRMEPTSPTFSRNLERRTPATTDKAKDLTLMDPSQGQKNELASAGFTKKPAEAPARSSTTTLREARPARHVSRKTITPKKLVKTSDSEEAFSQEDIALAKDQAQWVMSFLGNVAQKSESIQAQYIEDHVVEPVRLAAVAPFGVLNK